MKPELSVILVTADHLHSVRRTLRHLQAQDRAERIEVILVAPSDRALAGSAPEQFAGFLRFRSVFAGPIADVDRAAAAGIAVAAADVVAIVEDHAFPDRGWASALIERHRAGEWAAVGSTVINANPDSAFSWTNQLMAYGDFTEPVRGGEARHISRHNVSFKKSVLDQYGDRLVDLLGRGGGLLQDLQRKGHRLYLEPAARIRHANPSRFRSTLELRFFGGWLAGAVQVRSRRMSPAKRAAFALTAPVKTMTRLRKMGLKLLEPQHRSLIPRVLPTVVGALVLDGVGQMVGAVVGARGTEARLAAFEFDRLRHVTPEDRVLLAD